MKAFKSLDLFAQLILLGILGAAYIIGDPETLSPMLFLLAFAAMQIISIIIHLGSGAQFWKMRTWRKIHLIGTALVLAGIIVAMLQSDAARTGDKDDKYSMAGLDTMLYLTIPAILLALFYTMITLVEWGKMRREK